MALQIQNRRDFLIRSAMSMGAIIYSSSILSSCTDHFLPDPGDDKPPLFDPQFSWNDDAKIAVTSLIEMVPEAGDILGGLVDILWPEDQTDVWSEIKEQVEALIDQKIADTIYQQVQEDLDGLRKSLILYQNELKNGSPSEKLGQWLSTRNSFAEAQPHFQSPVYQLALLPLFVQFGNLYIGVVRDAVIAGQSWGRTDADHQQDISDLQNMLNEFNQYSTETYNTGRYALQQKTPVDTQHHIEPFKTLNAYDRQMYLTALDFSNLWPYLDVTKYPQGIPGGVKPAREIYSDPYGTCDDSGPIKIPTPPPTQTFTYISVWGGDRINAVQLGYPSGTGPGGVTMTPRMGDQRGGSNTGDYGGEAYLSTDAPMLAARATWGSIVNSLQFQFNDGTASSMLGGRVGLGSNDTGMIGFPLSALSNVHINGASIFYGSADCVVFGYLYWESPSDKLDALRDLYVRTPKERTAAELTRKLSSGVSGSNLITEELKESRKQHWAKLEARAKEIKG